MEPRVKIGTVGPKSVIHQFNQLCEVKYPQLNKSDLVAVAMLVLVNMPEDERRRWLECYQIALVRGEDAHGKTLEEMRLRGAVDVARAGGSAEEIKKALGIGERGG
jgi:hypothetical protein